MASENLNDEGPAWGGDLDDGEANDDYQPDIQLRDEQTQDPSHGANPSADFGDFGEDLGDDGGEYDPEAISTPAPVPPASQAKPTPPRTTGGFIVSDDSDSEDEEEAQAPAPAAADANPDVTPNAANTASSGGDQVVPLEPAPQGAQAANGSSADQAAGHPAQAPGAAVAGQPADRTTMLENRVKEDPRGDMDAWLALIEEYRRRNSMEQLRSAYNRFLEVFPQSVSSPMPSSYPLCRVTNWVYLVGRSMGVLGRARAKPQQLRRGRAAFRPLPHARAERAPLDRLPQLHSPAKRLEQRP